MRSHDWILLPGFLLASFIMTGCSSHDSSLENSVQAMLNHSTFDVNKLDKEASVVVAHGSAHRFYTREEIESAVAIAKSAGTKYDVSDFTILHEDTNGQFASVTYRATWKVSGGANANKVKALVMSHEIWEREKDGWLRVFAAMDITPNDICLSYAETTGTGLVTLGSSKNVVF